MFINNKYKALYDKIIANARNKNLKYTGYFENHHIIPKSLGGCDDPANIVPLTAKEHYICHHLLTKFTFGKNRSKMMMAYKMMLHKGMNKRDFRITARMHDRAKTYQSEISRNRKHTKETKQKISNSVRKWFNENKEEFKEAHKNRNVSELSRQLYSDASKRYWNNMTDEEYGRVCESRQGINNGMYGRSHTEEAKKAVSVANKGNQYALGIKQKIKTCPHCGKSGGNTMSRWHFDNCKFKT